MQVDRKVLEQALEALTEYGCAYLRHQHAYDEAITAIRAALEQCGCGDRLKDKCPGEWEPGCDLGNNPKYAKRVAWAPNHITDRQFYPPSNQEPLCK